MGNPDMTERFLRLKECADIMGVSPNLARSILSDHHVEPVDLGYGRGRGRRWLKSAVITVMLQLHAKAQPRPRLKRPALSASPFRTSLADLSISDIHTLTNGQIVQ